MSHDPQLSLYLARQALLKLHRTVTDAGWGQQMNSIVEFLRVLLSVEGDDLSMFRVRTVLMDPQHGLVNVVAAERARPLQCRTNEYERTGVLTRYTGGYISHRTCISHVPFHTLAHPVSPSHSNTLYPSPSMPLLTPPIPLSPTLYPLLTPTMPLLHSLLPSHPYHPRIHPGIVSTASLLRRNTRLSSRKRTRAYGETMSAIPPSLHRRCGRGWDRESSTRIRSVHCESHHCRGVERHQIRGEWHLHLRQFQAECRVLQSFG